MREKFWAFMARHLAAQDWLVVRLWRHARRTPYTTLRNRDGKLYMERWWLVGPTSWLRFVLPLMRFHMIHSRDLDRDPHDHPWAFRSFVLRGIFREVRFCALPPITWGDGELRMRIRDGHLVHGPGSTYRMELGEFHKIVELPGGAVLTLCILGGREEVWGFMDPHGAKIPWRSYLGLPADAPEGSQP